MRAIGYVRVSTDEQVVSIEAQEAKVRGYCALHEIDLVDVVRDHGVSAKSLDRPGLSDALARLIRGEADGLVIAKLDRLSRSVADWAVLIEAHFGSDAGRHLWSVGDSIDTRTAAGRMVLNILMSVAQWEREAIAERTRDALRHKRSNGERTGTIPRGAKLAGDGRTLVPDAVEMADLAMIRVLRDRDGLGARAISRLMAERTGRKWPPSTITRVLKRPQA
jgi:DNA invertase Pin-like site-specific DNA recombinase